MNAVARKIRLCVRLNFDELKEITLVARTLNLKPSTYLRFLALNTSQSQFITLDVAPLKKANFELAKQGNNLNQIAHFMNTHSHTCDKLDLEMIREAIEQQGQARNQVRQLLSALRQQAEENNIVLFDSRENEEEQNED